MDQPTSLQRTYRYLRIGIGATILVIFVGVGAVFINTHQLLPSISQYFYSPARSAFVGALIAASLLIFALAGRGPQRALLNAAAIFAPLIAFVSTPISGVDGCVSPVGCVPNKDAIADIDNGVAVYLVIGGAMLVALLLVVLFTKIRIGSVWVSLFIGGAVLIAVLLLRLLSQDLFLSYVHFVVSATFMLLIGAVAVLNVLMPDVDNPPTRWMQVVYWIVAGGMVFDMIFVTWVVISEHGPPAEGSAVAPAVPPVFLGETIALLLFTGFWAVQSAQKWNEKQPALPVLPS
jgi:FtsH-binding integral membrane protein